MFSDPARYPRVIEPFYYIDDAMLKSFLETDDAEQERKRP
jgi:hypothetical protein